MPTKNKQQKASGKEEPHQTLGRNVSPNKYSLSVKPDFGNSTFDGTVVIDVNIASATNEIQLNAAELTINSAVVISNGVVQQAVVKMDPDNERIVLKLANDVSHDAQVKIDFSGTNNDGMYGFYRSTYVDGDKANVLLTTQFESADARKAFPCFDEPEFKAVFDVSMIVPSNLECVSNMPSTSSTDLGNGLKEVKFSKSPKMSTYLLYLGIGNYNRLSDTSGNTEISVLTTPGNSHMAEVPLQLARKFLDFYEDYFGIKYPLPKLDLIAIPDFSAGAMENWGAITFREVDLLANKDTSIATLQRVAMVIAHELAHQWFGNLVTMKWWNDLWLNEAFAEFLGYKAMESIFPDWQMKREFIIEDTSAALSADQLSSTHPISVNVRSPADADTLFGAITYEKGGSILNMIESYAGKEIFREGLHRYLTTYSYSNATRADLWGFMDGVARERNRDVSVSKVASRWIDLAGYPSIAVSRTKSGVKLEQQRHFLLNNLSDVTSWPIPVNYQVSGEDHQLLMDGRTASIKMGRDQWIKLNFGQNGFYRVAYEGDDVDRLGALIAAKRVESIDSWGVHHDLFARTMSGRISAESYLDFVERYCKDADYPTNSSVLGGLSALSNALPKGKNERAKDMLIQDGIRLLDKLGWERKSGETVFDTMTRPSVILELGFAGHQPTISKAVQMFYAHMNNGEEIDSNIRGAVYYIAARSEGEKVFGLLKERFKSEKVAEEKSRLLKAMSMFADENLLLRSFDFAMSPDVKIQDTFKLISFGAYRNPAAKGIILKWTEDNFEELKSRYLGGTNMIGKFVEALSVLDTRQDLEEVIRFFSQKGMMRDDMKQAYADTTEQILANIQFLEANK